MLQRAIWAMVAATVLLPTVGLAWQSAWRGVLATLVGGLCWLLAVRGIRFMAVVALLATVGVAVFAALVQLNLLLVLAGVVAGVCSYDLLALRSRIQLAEAAEQERISRAHLQLLVPAALAGWLVGSLALVVQGSIGFAGLVLLTLVSMLLFTRAIQSLRNLFRGHS